jgi:hypothetical protein
VLVQDRCTACAKRTIGSEIAEHTIGVQIIFEPPDGTPR